MKKKVNEFEIICFSNGITLNGGLISETCSKALKTIENELPEEACNYEVYIHIINTCKEKLLRCMRHHNRFFDERVDKLW